MSEENNEESTESPSQEELDHHADQHNPNNPAYQDRLDNHADQLNPNNWKYEQSREDGREEEARDDESHED